MAVQSMALTILVLHAACHWSGSAREVIGKQPGFLSVPESALPPLLEGRSHTGEGDHQLKPAWFFLQAKAKDWVQTKSFAAIEPAVMLARRMMYRRQNGTQTPLTNRNPSTMGQPPPQATSPIANILAQLLQVLFQTFIAAVVAYLYSKHKPDFGLKPLDADKPETLNGRFKHGLFTCLDTPMLSLFTCCCGPIRWADTMRLVGLMTFTVGVAIMGVASSFHGTVVGLAAWLLTAVVGALYRQKLRVTFGMESSNTIIAVDCISWCCCSCCATVQEARQMEEAKALGHEAAQGELPLSFAGQ